MFTIWTFKPIFFTRKFKDLSWIDVLVHFCWPILWIYMTHKRFFLTIFACIRLAQFFRWDTTKWTPPTIFYIAYGLIKTVPARAAVKPIFFPTTSRHIFRANLVFGAPKFRFFVWSKRLFERELSFHYIYYKQFILKNGRYFYVLLKINNWTQNFGQFLIRY
jgi:hypothetical protein